MCILLVKHFTRCARREYALGESDAKQALIVVDQPSIEAAFRQTIPPAKGGHAQPATLPVTQPPSPLLFLARIAGFARGHGNALFWKALQHARQERR